MGRYSNLDRRKEKIFQVIRENGGEIFGMASIEDYLEICKLENEETVTPLEFINEAKSIIVIGLKMIDSIWDKLKGKEDIYSQNARNYLMHYNYDQLDYIAIQTSKYIENCGYDAYPIQSRSEDKSKGYLSGYFSFKSAAMAAGLGSKGKNSLVITNEFGPRVRWVVIITDIELPNNKAIYIKQGEQCGACRICIENCPKEALYFNEETLEFSIDKVKCQEQMDLCQCAVCQSICPKGIIAARQRRKKKYDLRTVMSV